MRADARENAWGNAAEKIAPRGRNQKRPVGSETLADRLGAANESRREEIFRKKGFHPLRKQRPGLLIGIADTTQSPCGPMDAVVVASNGLAMPFEHGELVFDGRQFARHVTGIAVVRHQLQRDLLTIAPNQQGNMRVLHSFRLIDGATYLIIVAFKNGLFLGPHRQNDLDRFAQLVQTLRSWRIVVAIGPILGLKATRPDPKGESSMREDIDGRSHLC